MISESPVQLPTLSCTFSKPKKLSLWAPALSWLSKPCELWSVRGKGSEVKPPEGNQKPQPGTEWDLPSSVQIVLLSSFSWATRHPRKMWKFSDPPEKIPTEKSTKCSSMVDSFRNGVSLTRAVPQSHSAKNRGGGGADRAQTWSSPQPLPKTCQAHPEDPHSQHMHTALSQEEKETPRVSWSNGIIQAFLGKAYKAY